MVIEYIRGLIICNVHEELNKYLHIIYNSCWIYID